MSGEPPSGPRPDAGFRHPLAVAAGLTAAAGIADAICYVGITAVFTANMSGNAILLGIGIGEGEPGDVVALLVALVSFALGVALASVLARRSTGHAAPVSASRRALGVEIALLALLVPTALVFVGNDGGPAVGLRRGVLIVIATLAMGTQTVVLRRVGSVAISTTYTSGVVAAMGETIALARTDHGAHPTARSDRIVVLTTVLALYVGGAAAGTALHRWIGTWALLAPLVAVVAVALAVRDRRAP